MYPQIIAICGYKRSGKDTIAKYLVKKYNYKHLKITYKLKESIKLLFDLTDNDLELDKKEDIDKKWDVSPRDIMQFLGTDVFQYKIQELLPNMGKNFWIKSFLSDILINNLNKKNYKIVISDLRFIHEYEELKKLNIPLKIIKVSNDNIINSSNSSLHISETEFIKIPYDYEIKNNTNIENLHKLINEYLEYSNIYD
jgi:hypothetical protein